MSWRTEKNNDSLDIVIDGWENGIADSPEDGIADLRNIEVLSVPKEGSVGFSMTAVTLPPVYNAVAFTCVAATNVITVTTTSGFYAGMAVIINSVSGAIGLSATSGQNTYYVSDITATTFKLYTNLALATLADILLDGSGTLSTAQLARPVDSSSAPSNTSSGGTSEKYLYRVILDSSGQLWSLSSTAQGGTGGTNILQFMGNTNHSSISGLAYGLVIWKRYILVLFTSNIDYAPTSILNSTTSPNGNWTAGWKSINNSNGGHKAIAAFDDAVYFCNGSAVGSILENAGTTFNPATSSTYTFNTDALTLPSYDTAKSLAQLGTTLLVGGVLTYVYPWDRVSTSFNYPLIVAETVIHSIVSTNSVAYIFAGHRGRIYQTNGANIDLFKKFPDQLSGTENPYYFWGGTLYYRNQLYFGIAASTTAAVAINNFAGIWAIDLDTGILRLNNSLSYATYTGTTPVIMPSGIADDSGSYGSSGNVGYAIIAGWVVSSAGGIDVSSSSPYTNYEAYIDTDIIPIGTYYEPNTSKQIEYKLSKPMVSGESVRIAWRGNLTDSFTTVFTDSTVGALSGASPVNFEKQQWIQLRISLSSTATTPSYTRLREVRIR